MRRAMIVAALFALSATASDAADRWWAGGGVGFGFGDVTFVSVEPVIGYAVNDRFDVGARLIFRYREDDRYASDLSTTDYGASVFGRYRVAEPVFLQLEYEVLSYEYLLVSGSTDRDNYDSLLAGAGIEQRLGDRSSLYASALYNFSYDDDELSPYDDPWVIRVGVGFGF